MSILQSFRSGTDSAAFKILLGALVLSFVAWGAGGMEDQSQIIATVDGVAITRSDRDRAYREMARSMGNLSPEQEETLGSQVSQKLIREEVLLAEAARLGITVADEEIARQIRKIKFFEDDDGKFSEKLYNERVKRLGYRAGQFEERMRRDLLVQRFAELLSRGVVVTRAEVEDLIRAQSTEVTVSYVRLSTTLFYDDVAVSDGDRDSFIKANADKIKKSYDDDFERFYNMPRRIRLSMILLRNDIGGTDSAALKAKAEEIRTLAAGGADFADLARRFSEDLTAETGGNLGLRPAAQLDPAEVAAADQAGLGKVSSVVETARGLEILKVDAIEEAKVRSLEEATADIAVKLIRADRVGGVMKEYAQSVLANWTDAAAPPLVLLANQGLTVEATESFVLGAGEVPGLGKDAAILAALATAPAGSVLPTPFEVRGSTVIVAVLTRDEPEAAELAARRDMMEARIRSEREQQVFERWIDDRVAKATVVMEAR